MGPWPISGPASRPHIGLPPLGLRGKPPEGRDDGGTGWVGPDSPPEAHPRGAAAVEAAAAGLGRALGWRSRPFLL